VRRKYRHYSGNGWSAGRVDLIGTRLRTRNLQTLRGTGRTQSNLDEAVKRLGPDASVFAGIEKAVAADRYAFFTGFFQNFYNTHLLLARRLP